MAQDSGQKKPGANKYLVDISATRLSR